MVSCDLRTPASSEAPSHLLKASGAGSQGENPTFDIKCAPHVNPCEIVIHGDKIWSNARYRVFGTLLIKGTLTVEDAIVEMVSDYPREHGIIVEKKGRLISERAVFGGNRKPSGAPMYTFIEVHGVWNARSTRTQVNYGIRAKTTSRIWANQLVSGEDDGSLIPSGQANVYLKNSSLALVVVANIRHEGGKFFSLNVPEGVPLNRNLNATTVPGARYQVTLKDTSIRKWLIYFQGVTNGGQPTTIHIKQAGTLLPRIVSDSFTGQMRLPTSFSYRANGTRFLDKKIPAGTIVKNGTLRLKFVHPTWIQGWSIQLSGLANVNLLAPTFITEAIMSDDATLNAQGAYGIRNIEFNATTIKMHNRSRLNVTNVKFGTRPGTHVTGHIDVQRFSRIHGERVTLRNLQFGISETGRAHFLNSTMEESVELLGPNYPEFN